MRKTYILFVLIGLIFLSANTFLIAQNTYKLDIIVTDQDSVKFSKDFNYQNRFPEQNKLTSELKRLKRAFYEKAYLSANFDSSRFDSSQNTMFAYLYLGKQYEWARLDPGNVDDGVLSEVGFRDKLYMGKIFHYKQVLNLYEKLLTHYENRGYPFASISLDSVTFEDNLIIARLKLERNRQFRFDSLIIKGDAIISNVYLASYLGITPGRLYDESLVSRVSTRINELQFLKEKERFMLIFHKDEELSSDDHLVGKTDLQLFLNARKANLINGIIGILPDEQRKGKFSLVGDAHLLIQNPFGEGKLIDINWKKLQFKTQDLKAKFLYPFVLSSPFGLDFQISIYKKDTTYSDFATNIGIQYILTGGNYFKVYVNNKLSRLISTDQFETATTLPSFADVNTRLYGLGYKWQRLDYRYNPRKGYSLLANIGAGTKEIQKNAKLPEELYENLDLKTMQIEFDLELDWFVPLKKSSVINLGSQIGYMYNQQLFQNELFRIGGLRSLRGFDEESIYASLYEIFTLEYRYLLEQNSYVYLFVDGGYYQDKSRNNNLSDIPFGFGSGISFETKAGIFSVNYALGSQKGNPPDLRTGKIHFGLVNYF